MKHFELEKYYICQHNLNLEKIYWHLLMRKSLLTIFLFFFVVFGYSLETAPSAKELRLNLLVEHAEKLVVEATNHDSVLVILNEADQVAHELHDLHQTNHILILKGLIEYYAGNYEQAIDFYFQALSLVEQANDSALIAKVNLDLGLIYDDLEDYDEAINYFNKSLKISSILNDSSLIAKTYQNMAISYQNLKDMPKALEYNEKANHLAIIRNDTKMMIDITNNFGTIAYDQKQLDKSLGYYLKSLDLYLNINDRQGLAMAYNNIGLVFLDKKEYKKSFDYFMKSLKLAKELKMNDFIGGIYGNLTFYYEAKKDYKNAFICYDRSNVLSDSLMGERKSKVIRQIQAKYQLDKNNRELIELKQTNQTQLHKIDSAKSVQIYLISITCLVVVLMAATFWLLFKEKRLATKLKATTSELHDLNLSKDKFFSIIAHDLKNPFNVLVSYTSILKTDLDLFSKDELRLIVSDLNQASENGFELLQNLLVWSRSQTNRIQVYKTNFNLLEVIDQVKALVELNLQSKKQQLIIHADPAISVFADKDMISTVLRNLIFNAIKFSDHGSDIILKSVIKGEFIHINVIDYGIGIAPEMIDHLFRIDKDTASVGTDGETGTGLGLLICREFIHKNDGQIWVESEYGKGSVFSISIPLSPESQA